MVRIVNQKEFEEIIETETKLVLADFYADWCGPCRNLAPKLDKLASDNAETLTVIKVNVDDQPGMAEKYDVTALPSLLFFKNKELLEKVVGANMQSIEKSLSKHQ